MITSSTTTASNPVAACKSSAGTLSLSEPTIDTAINHVIKVAPKPTPAPMATGRRYACFAPVMLAVIAASTRMHSRPSRKTSTPMSRNATVGLVLGRSGSGAPCSVTPCQTRIATTARAAAQRLAARITGVRRAVLVIFQHCSGLTRFGSCLALAANSLHAIKLPRQRKRRCRSLAFF